MKRTVLLLLSVIFIVSSCNSNYETVEALIIDTKAPTRESDYFVATIEYYVDSVRYTDDFKVSFWRMVEDSISVPAKGITFDILYDPDKPNRNEIDYNIKAKYKE